MNHPIMKNPMFVLVSGRVSARHSALLNGISNAKHTPCQQVSGTTAPPAERRILKHSVVLHAILTAIRDRKHTRCDVLYNNDIFLLQHPCCVPENKFKKYV